MWRAVFLSMLFAAGFYVNRAIAQTQPTPTEASEPAAVINANEVAPSYARAANSSFAPANDFPTKTLTGPLSGIGNTLVDAGFNFRLPSENQTLDNVSEGSNPGTVGSGTWIIPTLTIDLGKIIGLQNGRIRFADEINMLRVNDNAGPKSFQFAANSGPLGTAKQNIKEPTSLRQFSYEQLLFDKRLDFEGGRVNMKKYFWTPNCDVDSLTCLDLMLERNAGLPPSAFSSWGGRIAYNVTRDVYVQAGIEQIDPHTNSTTGWAWGLRNDNGVFFAGEVAYKSDFHETAYPSDYEFGAWHVTSTHTDPADSSVTRHGTGSVQFWGNKTVWRQDGGATRSPKIRHVNLFIQAAKSIDNTSVYSTHLSVGASLYAPFKSRPLDIIQIQATYLELTTDEQQFLNSQRVKSGGPGGFPTNSYYLDVNAHIQLYKFVALEPTFEYVIDPDTIFNAKVSNARTGWVVGATLVLDPARLLGLGG